MLIATLFTCLVVATKYKPTFNPEEYKLTPWITKSLTSSNAAYAVRLWEFADVVVVVSSGFNRFV